MAKSKYIYALPFSRRIKTKVVSDPNVHKGKLKYALDFPMNEGTLILAARDGVVTDLKDKFSVGGNDIKLADKANYITIHHGENEFSQYVHLKYKGVLVRKGQNVKKGDPIGLSGNTGYSTQPHLHFMVFNIYGSDENDWESLEIIFE